MWIFLRPFIWIVIGINLFTLPIIVDGKEAFAKTRACRRALGQTLQPFLSYESLTSERQTVFFVELSQRGDVVLLKTGDVWDSDYQGFPYAITRQGDPRFPMALWGTKLAEKLQCSIVPVRNSRNLKVRFPGSRKFRDIIFKINKRLKAVGLSPIVYLPVASSFLETQSILDLALEASDDFQLFFPYVDNAPRLTTHEVSFHLGSIIFPNKFFERAKAINLYTREFIRYLKSKKRTLGPITNKIVRQLEIERVAELDLGSGGLVATLGSLRLLYGSEKSYAQILPRISPNEQDRIMNHIDNLARPSMVPIDALLARLQWMTGVSMKGISRSNLSLEYLYTLRRYGIGKRVPLNRVEKIKLERLVADFLKSSRFLAIPSASVEIASAEQWMKELGPYLDNRIQQILDVLL